MASTATTAHTVYLDVCCLNRPFDDQTQLRIRLEAEAITLILTRVRAGVWRWLTSGAVEFELNAGPTGPRRQWIEQLLRFASESAPISPPVVARAQQLVALGFRALDALHLACAESGQADVLLTTDDQFLRVARRNAARLHVTVHNPVSWLQEVSAT
jgi:predicted nucleic acid-binding protein